MRVPHLRKNMQMGNIYIQKWCVLPVKVQNTLHVLMFLTFFPMEWGDVC